ncbi:hypothetical protein ACFLZ2_04410 [Candidatus Margulisiibacteriota bacterium]
MKLSLKLRHAIVGWVFFICFAVLLHLFDRRTYANLYKMFIVKDTIGLFIIILAGLPVGYLISQVSWAVFSLWPVNFKFPWAVVADFKKVKVDGIAEDSQSDHAYFKDADEKTAYFNHVMTETYSLHMDVITAIVLAFISIYLRIFQTGINIARVLRYPGTSRLILLFVLAAVLLVIALIVNARNCRRDLIDQKRLWNKEKLDDKAKYIHLNPVLMLVPIVIIGIMFLLKALIWWQIFFLVLLYLTLSLFSLYKVSV